MEPRQQYWLIANSQSGGTDGDAIQSVKRHIEDRGGEVFRMTDLSEQELPDASAVDEREPLVIVAYGGDGTATAVASAFGNTHAPLLILPGGTMNLLAKRLHGDFDCAAIVDAVVGHWNPKTVQLPVVRSDEWTALTGVIAGPATAWGDVREHLRQGDVGAMVETAMEAFQASRAGPRIGLDGYARDFSAVFVEAAEDGLIADAIQAESIGEMALHGVAWLNRDFLGGPRERIGAGKTLCVTSQDGDIGLLVDGEREWAGESLRLWHDICPARFLSAQG